MAELILLLKMRLPVKVFLLKMKHVFLIEKCVKTGNACNEIRYRFI